MAVISTLLFAGPRAEELCNLLWRDVNLANGRIIIGRSKTQAGLREIDLLPVLRDTLATHKANAYRSGPDDLVFPTGPAGAGTATTCAVARSAWRSSGPTSCWQSAGSPRSHAASRPTSCATPSPRFWSPPARTPPR